MPFPKYSVGVGWPLIPFYSKKHSLFTGDMGASIDPETVMPPVGEAVMFTTRDDEMHVGETVLLKAGEQGQRTIGAFFERVGETRRLHLYQDVLSWQLREDSRDAFYDTDLFIRRDVERRDAVLSAKKEEVYEVGFDKSPIPLSRADGSFHPECIIPSRGLFIGFWLTQDARHQVHGEVMHITQAGPRNRSDTVICVSRSPFTQPRARSFVFLEEVKDWQRARRLVL